MYDARGRHDDWYTPLLPDIRREGNGKNGLRQVVSRRPGRCLRPAKKPARYRTDPAKLVGGAKIFCLPDRRGSRISAGECQREKDAAGTDLAIVSRTQGKIMTERLMAGSEVVFEIETVNRSDTGSKMNR